MALREPPQFVAGRLDQQEHAAAKGAVGAGAVVVRVPGVGVRAPHPRSRGEPSGVGIGVARSAGRGGAIGHGTDHAVGIAGEGQAEQGPRVAAQRDPAEPVVAIIGAQLDPLRQ